jgi:choice-of-anchor B domain-containing protein
MRIGTLAGALGLGLAAVPLASAHDIELGDQELGGSALVSELDCNAGSTAGFPCWNAHLHAWIPTTVFGEGPGNDIWGWTNPRSGQDIAIIGLFNGVAFVDVSDPHNPVHLGVLHTQTTGSSWNDIKVYDGHAFVVSEAPGHGMQILDLAVLETLEEGPVELQPTLHYAGFGNAHNLAIDEETGFAYAVGTNTCRGGLHIVDVRDPRRPQFAGCFDGDGYTHDTQCVRYRGPDADHAGREVCFSSNEDTVTLVDVTNKAAPQMISRTGYAGRGYTHQGWLTEDHEYFLLGDEFDELRFGHRMRTYVWNMLDLDAPFVAGAYTGTRNAIDHNLFVVGNHVYEANYRAGLRVLRMGDLDRAELAEVAFFDTFPQGDGNAFQGAWGVYPFLESGTILVSDINRGLFLLGVDLTAVPECSDGIDNDRDGLTDHPDDDGCDAADGAAELLRTDVAIDVKPGHAGSPVRAGAGGVLPVAVLGSPDFDVASIDPASLALGPGRAPLDAPARYRDVDRDGSVDLYGHYRLREAALDAGDGQVCLRWEILDGTRYEGCDAVRHVPVRRRVGRGGEGPPRAGRGEAVERGGPPPAVRTDHR